MSSQEGRGQTQHCFNPEYLGAQEEGLHLF